MPSVVSGELQMPSVVVVEESQITNHKFQYRRGIELQITNSIPRHLIWGLDNILWKWMDVKLKTRLDLKSFFLSSTI